MALPDVDVDPDLALPSLSLDQSVACDVAIRALHPRYFAGLEALQRAAYPTLAEHEILCERHFATHYAVFAEGQHVAVHTQTGRVVGMNCGTSRVDNR